MNSDKAEEHYEEHGKLIQDSEDGKHHSPKPKKAKRSSSGLVPGDDKVEHDIAKAQPLAHRLFAKFPPTSRNRGRRKQYMPSRNPIARGSVAHIIRSRFGVLDETLLVDSSLEDSGKKLPDSTDVAPSNIGTDRLSGGVVKEVCESDLTERTKPGTDGVTANEAGESGPIEHVTTDQPRTVPDFTTNSGRPKQPLRMCFRSTVMPISSSQIPKEKYRVIVVDGTHKAKTGTSYVILLQFLTLWLDVQGLL